VGDDGGRSSDLFEGQGIERRARAFRIAGGDFRMIASFNFERATCFIKFVGSHAEYDKIDALTVSLY
jgi:mRNA interferase HigB